MKTKSLTLLLLIFTYAVWSQEKGLPETKEEAISWLNLNGKDFLKSEKRIFYGSLEYQSQLMKSTIDTLKLADYFFKNGKPTEQIDISAIPFSSILIQDYFLAFHEKDSDNNYLDNKYFVINTTDYHITRFNPLNTKEKSWKRHGIDIYYHKDNEENAKLVFQYIILLAKLNGAKENPKYLN